MKTSNLVSVPSQSLLSYSSNNLLLFDIPHFTSTNDSLYKITLYNKPTHPETSESYSFEKIFTACASALVEFLNNKHNLSLSVRAWMIMIGPWLYDFLSTVYPILLKTYTFSRSLNCNQSDCVSYIHPDALNLIPNPSSCTSDSKKSLECINELYLINSVIINYFLQGRVTLVSKPIPEEITTERRTSFLPILKGAISKALINISFLIPLGGQDPIITKTYLGSVDLFKLHLRLRCIPRFYGFSSKLNIDHLPSINLRHCLSYSLEKSFDVSNHFSHILGRLLSQYLPICFLEGFGFLYAKALAYTKRFDNPRFIYDCNHFYSSELFKCFSALLVDRGTTLVLGQHGNNYQTLNYPLGSTIEQNVATYFLVWGKHTTSSNNIPSFISRSLQVRNKTDLVKSNVLIILPPIPSFSQVSLYKYNHYDVVENLPSLLANLPQDLLNKIIIRPYRSIQPEYLSSIIKSFEHQLESTSVRINFKSSFSSQVYSSKIAVFLYDSTGFMQCASANIPCMMLCDSYANLNSFSRRIYNKLIAQKVIYTSLHDLILNLSDISNNVTRWWNSRPVSDSVLDYCSQFSRYSRTPSLHLYKILTSLKCLDS